MTLKDQALTYHTKYGWNTLPCMGDVPSKGKVPLVSWREWQGKKITTKEIEKWWDKDPEANIGLITGVTSGIVVLDVDGADIKSLHIPPTATATTTEGRYHYYFKHPGFTVNNSAGRLAKGLDFRGDGGIVILPPSQHFDKSGNPDVKYTWMLRPSEVGFADMPEWLIEKVKAKSWTADKFDWSKAINIKEGARDETLHKAACSLLGKGIEYETALAILQGLNATYKPPLDDSVVVEKLKGAVSFIKDSNPGLTPGDGSGMSRVFVPKLLKNITTSDIIAMSWVWEGFLLANHTTLLSAYWKSGKSTLLTQLLKALETGVPFLGRSTTPSRVLVVSEESETIWYRRRIENELSADSTWILSQPVLTRFKPAEWLKFIEDTLRVCETNSINLVVFDTISAFWPLSDESNASAMQDALLPLNSLTKAGLSLLLIHHFRKSGGTEGLAARGSGALGSAVDIMVDFSRPKGDDNSTQRHLTCLSRFEETPREVVCDYQDGEYIFLGSPQDVQEQKRFSTLKDILSESDQPMTAEEIREAWDEEIHGKKPKTAKTIKRNLSKLVFLGEVKGAGSKKIKGGDATLYLGHNNNVQGTTLNDEIVPITPDISDGTPQKKEITPLNSLPGLEAYGH